ncbi:MAG: hypothetical protein ACKOBO_04395 [Acidimicrobiales bacterium]
MVVVGAGAIEEVVVVVGPAGTDGVDAPAADLLSVTASVVAVATFVVVVTAGGATTSICSAGATEVVVGEETSVVVVVLVVVVVVGRTKSATFPVAVLSAADAPLEFVAVTSNFRYVSTSSSVSVYVSEVAPVMFE